MVLIGYDDDDYAVSAAEHDRTIPVLVAEPA